MKLTKQKRQNLLLWTSVYFVIFSYVLGYLEFLSKKVAWMGMVYFSIAILLILLIKYKESRKVNKINKITEIKESTGRIVGIIPNNRKDMYNHTVRICIDEIEYIDLISTKNNLFSIKEGNMVSFRYDNFNKQLIYITK